MARRGTCRFITILGNRTWDDNVPPVLPAGQCGLAGQEALAENHQAGISWQVWESWASERRLTRVRYAAIQFDQQKCRMSKSGVLRRWPLAAVCKDSCLT